MSGSPLTFDDGWEEVAAYIRALTPSVRRALWAAAVTAIEVPGAADDHGRPTFKVVRAAAKGARAQLWPVAAAFGYLPLIGHRGSYLDVLAPDHAGPASIPAGDDGIFCLAICRLLMDPRIPPGPLRAVYVH